MGEFLEPQGFIKVKLENTTELVWGKRVDQENFPLTLRVYTGINPSGASRGVGQDAIRICLFMKTQDGKIVWLGGSKRVHRVVNWKINLQKRLNNWLEFFPKSKCPKCSLPVVLRDGKFGKFLSCVGYPICKHTEKYEK